MELTCLVNSAPGFHEPYFSGSAFQNLSDLKNISFGPSVTTIPNQAFKGCSGLTSIEIPESVTFIGNYAFSECSDLTEVTIADGDSELQCGDHAFYNAWIETLYLGRNITNNPFADNESLKNLTIQYCYHTPQRGFLRLLRIDCYRYSRLRNFNR